MAQPVSENVEKQCQMLLDHILQNDLSAEFVVPIPESDHEYHSIIDSPMDLTKIRIRLSQGDYRRSLNPGLRKPFGGLLRFLDDLLNVWCNALGYNVPKSAVHRQSEALQAFTKRYVEEKLVPFWADLRHRDFHQHFQELVAKWQATEESICARAMAQITENAVRSPRRTENSKRRRPGTEEGYPTVALENEAALPVGLGSRSLCLVAAGVAVVRVVVLPMHVSFVSSSLLLLLLLLHHGSADDPQGRTICQVLFGQAILGFGQGVQRPLLSVHL
jgi:hypothetical protein